MKRSQTSAKDPDEIQLLEVTEQEAIIESLKNEARTQSLRIRNSFFVVYVFVILIFLFCLINFLVSPYDAIHQMRFKNIVSYEVFVLFYSASIYSFCVGAAIVKVCNIILYIYHLNNVLSCAARTIFCSKTSNVYITSFLDCLSGLLAPYILDFVNRGHLLVLDSFCQCGIILSGCLHRQ
jgi:hypothetical protein